MAFSAEFFLVLLLLHGAYAVTTTYTMPGVVNLSSGTTQTSVLTITDTGVLSSADLVIDWTSGLWMPEVFISLESPSGTVQIISDGDWISSNCDVSFNSPQGWSDLGIPWSCPTTTVPPVLIPDSPFSTFISESITGDWTLSVRDENFALDDNNEFSSWSLILTFPGGSGGDPHLLLFDGRTVDISTDNFDSVFVNLFSSTLWQVNAAVRDSTLSSNVKYIQQAGISVAALSHYRIYFDTNQSLQLNADVLITAVDSSNGETLYDFYSVFQQSGEDRMDFLLNSNNITVTEEGEEHTSYTCRLSLYREDYMDLQVFNAANVVEWRQSPLIRSLLQCSDGMKMQIEVHQFQYEVEEYVGDGLVWIKSGNQLYPALEDRLNGEEYWIDRRIDVYFTQIPREMESDGLVGQFHIPTSVEGVREDRKRVVEERLSSSIEYNQETGRYETEISEEFVLREESVFSNAFDANLYD